MNISFFNGVSGLLAFQQEMDVLSHNMANVNTVGYKGTRASFDDLLYTEMDTNAERTPLTGHGARVSSVDLLCGQGPIKQTNNLLDLAIVGEGFFAVERDGRVEYTRNGGFDVSVEGSSAYLVTRDGAYVLDAKGKHIKLEWQEGGDIYELSNLAGKVGVYLFHNPYELKQTDISSFLETGLSGAPYTIKKGRTQDAPYQVEQYALEASNIELTDQMVNLIVTQKAYQMNAKMVQTADQLEEIVNNLR